MCISNYYFYCIKKSVDVRAHSNRRVFSHRDGFFFFFINHARLPKDGASLVSDMAQLLASEFLLSICDLIECEPRLPAYCDLMNL